MYIPVILVSPITVRFYWFNTKKNLAFKVSHFLIPTKLNSDYSFKQVFLNNFFCLFFLTSPTKFPFNKFSPKNVRFPLCKFSFALSAACSSPNIFIHGFCFKFQKFLFCSTYHIVSFLNFYNSS